VQINDLKGTISVLEVQNLNSSKVWRPEEPRVENRCIIVNYAISIEMHVLFEP
jgi:hypothetical protein